MGVSAHPYKKKDKNQINTNKIMEQNMTTIPFDLELAKRINNGEYNGCLTMIAVKNPEVRHITNVNVMRCLILTDAAIRNAL